MALPPTPITLTKDTWTLVLANKTTQGRVFVLDIEEEPTSYQVAVVAAGDPKPSDNYDGGIKFDVWFSPDQPSSIPGDFYVLPKDRDGKVVVFE